MNAPDRDSAPAAHHDRAPAEDRLLVKARHILDLVEKRDRHFQHSLMADRAMGVMLSLFLAEFADASDGEAACKIASAHAGPGEDEIIAGLLEAGLIETGLNDSRNGGIGLTPLGAGRIRSFISAYPESL